MFLERKIEWAVLFIYTLINGWILSYFLFDGSMVWAVALLPAGNSNLFAIFIGLFFNTGLILYTKLLTSRALEALLLVIYSYLNLRVFFPFLLEEGGLEGITISQQGGSHNLFAIMLGLFLNVALIIYWLKKKET